MADQEKSFKVVDRRRFTSEGELRPDAPPDVVRTPTPDPSPMSPSHKERNKTDKAQKDRPRSEPPGIDFMTFVASLATNALAAMGALPEGRAAGMPVDPGMAREYIDIIAMLEDKTRGNLTADENQALHRLLSELRMHFVELTQSKGGLR